MAAPNTFAGARLDRVTVRRRDPSWVAAQLADPASRAVVASVGRGARGRRPAGWRACRWTGWPRPCCWALQDGRALFAADGSGRDDLVGVREIVPQLAQDEGGLIAYAAALLNWHRRHGHCSVCGAESEVREAGLLRVCPACGAEHHPRTDPVVIMLVVDEERDRVLLGRQASWPERRYSALAGFVEPGESLEDAVAREVLRGVGSGGDGRALCLLAAVAVPELADAGVRGACTWPASRWRPTASSRTRAGSRARELHGRCRRSAASCCCRRRWRSRGG